MAIFQSMINRARYREKVERGLQNNPIVLLTGPRQSGKTTLARLFVPQGRANYFDLEDPTDLARLNDPMINLLPLKGVVVIDEIQRRPDLFPTLRVLADHPDRQATFLILGSASGDLMRQSSESLAGRVARIEISGFSLSEIGTASTSQLWLRGGFPRSYLAASEEESIAWRQEFILTLLERDLPQWGVRTPAAALHRFWRMLAHYHGQTWNASEPAQALGVDHKTVQRYLDLLTDAFMIRQLPPFLASIGKRQVKSPKIYFRDSGLFHALIGVRNNDDLMVHPKLGFSWEGYALDQVINAIPHQHATFWGTHQKAEIDLILEDGKRRRGYEFKRSDAPGLSRSMVTTMEDLGLESITVVYPGKKRYLLREGVEVVPLETLVSPT